MFNVFLLCQPCCVDKNCWLNLLRKIKQKFTFSKFQVSLKYFMWFWHWNQCLFARKYNQKSSELFKIFRFRFSKSYLSIEPNFKSTDFDMALFICHFIKKGSESQNSRIEKVMWQKSKCTISTNFEEWF